MHRNWTNGGHGMMDLWTQNSGWFIVYDLVKVLIIAAVILFISRMLIKA